MKGAGAKFVSRNEYVAQMTAKAEDAAERGGGGGGGADDKPQPPQP